MDSAGPGSPVCGSLEGPPLAALFGTSFYSLLSQQVVVGHMGQLGNHLPYSLGCEGRLVVVELREQAARPWVRTAGQELVAWMFLLRLLLVGIGAEEGKGPALGLLVAAGRVQTAGPPGPVGLVIDEVAGGL